MASSPLFCTNCGAANRLEAAFCFACGHSLEAPDTATFVASRASTSTITPLLTQNLLKDRYRIMGQLGAGGMGAVYKAEDTLFNNRLVAIKEMSQGGLNSQQRAEAAADFKREAHMLADLQHPSLPTIHDYFSDEGQWYLVMDFIEGKTLEEVLTQTQGGWLPIGEALAIGIQLCTVLEYLHGRQPPIIFRDLKPANVMRTGQGQTFLIDFGIARHFKPGQMKDTVSFGSAGYAAPEQYGKTQTTPRSDIYSLGAMLHQCLTGNDPTNNSPTPFDFPPLNLHGQPAPPELEALILTMVTINPDKRPIDMAFVRYQLQQLQQSVARLTIPTPSPHLVISQKAVTPVPAQKSAMSTTPPVAPAATLSPLPTSPKVPVPPVVPPPPPPKTTTYSIYQGHTSPVAAMAWSPDGNSIASGDLSGKIHIWTTKDMHLRHTYKSHSSAIQTVAWSPNRNRIASGDSNGSLDVWNASSGQRLYRYRGYAITIASVAWSPDGKRIAFGDSSGRVQIQDALDGSHSTLCSRQLSRVRIVAWSPDGNYIAWGDSDGKVQIWDTSKNTLIDTYQQQVSTIYAIAWSPDSKLLASGDANGTVQVRSVLHGSTSITLFRYRYSGHTGDVMAVAWSPYGKRIVSGGMDTTVHVWDAVDGGHPFIYDEHTGPIYAVAWSPYGTQIASAGADKTVRVWVAK